MADQQKEVPEKTLPVVHRFITTHNAEGKPTFETGIKEEIDFERSPLGGDMFLAYSGVEFPVALGHDSDLNQYKAHLEKKPESFMIPGGFLSRYIDYHPGCLPLWHRTITLDFGIVVEGQIQLELESGEKRILKKGDVAIQRGTNHAWSNPSKTEFARVFYVAMDAKPPVVNGQELGESLGVVSH
uniref:SpoI n=1 Tax=Hypomontagnella monticulosa TaxID=2487000 RepID=A0A7U3NJW5_9PEZI|nr:SpoI [Hypomontagnella monticulosa]